MSQERNVPLATAEAIEGAVALLRRTPLGAFAFYYAGAGAWVLGLLFFWAEVTWFRPGDVEIAGGALGLGVLYLVLVLAQAEFCSVLMAVRSGEAVPAFSWRRIVGRWEGQLVVQGTGLLAAAVASVVIFPTGWVYAYLQYASVIGSAGSPAELRRKAWEAAQREPAENHLFLGALTLIGVAGLINVASLIGEVPALAHTFLGTPDIFRETGLSLRNTTFIATVLAVVWLAIDPLAKAYYVGAMYRHRARATGEDLLEIIGRRKPALKRAAMVAIALALTAPRLAAAQAAPAAVDPKQLDASIAKVLSGHDYEWRLRPLDGANATPVSESPNPIVAFFEHLLSVVMKAIGEVLDWLARKMMGAYSGNPSPGGDGATTVVTVLLYCLIGVILLLIIWVVWLVVRQSASAGPALQATGLPAKPDLNDENVQAVQLPSSGWLAIAREKMAAGEWRLALRALYLASLADLGSQGLVTLARSKTNREYERELGRREASRGGTDGSLLRRFSGRMRLFEDVWYGQLPAEESVVRGWLGDWEGQG